MATISIGVVLVLLLGEIDLSVGAVSGLAAGVMAVLTRPARLGAAARDRSPGSASASAIGALQRLHRHHVRGPLVRGHARRTARLAGRVAIRARRHRLGQPAAEHHHRPDDAPSSTRRSAGSSAIVAIAAYAGSLLLARRRRRASRARGRRRSTGDDRPPRAGRGRRSSRRSRSSTPTAACRWRR